MKDWLNRQGLPVRYAAVGLAGGVLAVIVARVTGWFSADIGTVLACVVGAALGGLVRQWTGKTR